MTALASWCQGDAWMGGIAADEIVPMAFRMASGDRAIRSQLAEDGHFRAKDCNSAVGMATDEAPVSVIAPRHYYFAPRPWSAALWDKQSEEEKPRGKENI
jgi:hypothetical protein